MFLIWHKLHPDTPPALIPLSCGIRIYAYRIRTYVYGIRF